MKNEKPQSVPKEHQLECPTCGRIIDLRDLAQVFSHGFLNEETNEYECLSDEEIEKLDIQYGGSIIQYGGSIKVGDSIFWTKDKKPIHF